MLKMVKSKILVSSLVLLSLALNAVSEIFPNEFAFCFCSVVFPQYVDLVIYVHNLSDQFRPVWWPWQR